MSECSRGCPRKCTRSGLVVCHLVCFHLLCPLPILRHVMRAIWSVRPKCSHRCVSLKETPLKPVQILKHKKKINRANRYENEMVETYRDLNCSGASPNERKSDQKVTERVPKTKRSDRTPFADLLLRHPENIVSTPPICIVVRLPLALRYASHLRCSAFVKISVVVVAGMFPTARTCQVPRGLLSSNGGFQIIAGPQKRPAERGHIKETSHKEKGTQTSGLRIFLGGVGVFHVKGWGPKSSVCPSKPRETKLFGGISRHFAGISGGHPKSLRKKVYVQFSSPNLKHRE